MFNCSDIVVSTREIVRLVHGAAGISGALPDEAPAPTGVMRSDALQALGVRFGGRDRLEGTINALVAAVSASV